MKKCILALLIVGSSYGVAPAQDVPPQTRRWPLIITAFNEAWAIPTTQLIKNPIHPGVSAGTAYSLRETDRSRLSLNGTLGYYYHQNIQHNLHLIVSLNYQRNLLAGLHLGAGIGLGYSHSFYPTPVYKLKGEEYEQVKDWGKPTLMPAADLSLGYTFNRKSAKPFALFTKYQFVAEWPYAPENTFPVLPHTMFHVGVQFYPFN